MPEILYLTGAIRKEGGRLADDSVRFIQLGCGIADFQPPTGRQRISVVESLRLKIGTEKNGGLVEGVAIGKYDWAIVGEDMVENLPDDERDNVVVVRKLGFQHCQYRLGIWEGFPEGFLVAEGRDRVETLEDLKSGTRIATKYYNLLNRIVRERGLNLNVIQDKTPETAPEFSEIFVVADNFEIGGTWFFQHISEREILLESQAVLIRARRFPRGRRRIFNEQLLPRIDQALKNPERWLNTDP